jgi:hypothetical protein
LHLGDAPRPFVALRDVAITKTGKHLLRHRPASSQPSSSAISIEYLLSVVHAYRLRKLIMPKTTAGLSNLDVLRYRLYKEGEHHEQHFTNSAAANLLHTLYVCLFGDEIDAFLLREDYRPRTADWQRVKKDGTLWSLADAQKKEFAKKSRPVRKGKICGNYLARGDRCFNCK